MTNFHSEGLLVALQFLGAAAGLSAIVAALVAMGYGVLRGADNTRTAKPYWVTVRRALPYVFLLALIGGLTGQLGGGSREGVVGELLPAVMALFGPFIAYFLGSKRDQAGKISVNALAFLLSFFVMYNVAAVWRQDNENFEFCQKVFSDPDIDGPAEMEAREVYWMDYCKTVDTGMLASGAAVG